MRFKIAQSELQKRAKYIKLGVFFASILVIFIAYNNAHYPEKYNDVLYWSIIGFTVLANLIGYYRYRRYCNLAKEHWVEVHPEQVHFYTNGELSKLVIKDISALIFYRKKGLLEHIQIKLKNNRGIRLEGYEDLNVLGDLISEQVPKAHIMDD